MGSVIKRLSVAGVAVALCAVSCSADEQSEASMSPLEPSSTKDEPPTAVMTPPTTGSGSSTPTHVAPSAPSGETTPPSPSPVTIPSHSGPDETTSDTSDTSADDPAPAAPIDCSAIAAAGYQVCSEGDDACGVVFTDGSGCSSVCAKANLKCAAAYEDVDGQCAADATRPAVACDSGHQSDYCSCAPDSQSGSIPPAPSASSDDRQSSAEPEPSSDVPPTNAPCAVPDYIFEETTPIGWAAQGSGTTGGGDASPALVSSLTELQAAVGDATPRVVYVQGELAPGLLDVGSNKTIIGCSSGAHVQGTISIGKGSSNVILRNLNISGYAVGDCSKDPGFDASEGCSSGSDAVGVNGDAHHVWVDHCSIKDGTDGNLDITNDADFVTVSWTKFSYTPRTDNVGNDSTGASGHRFSNLVGGTDTAPSGWPGKRPLNVTWHHNWWAENVVERQPRVRFGRNHLFNNYYSSSASSYCVRAGIEASILLQANVFEGVKSPHQFNNESNQATAFIELGSGGFANTYNNVSGTRAEGGGGAGFEPPYAFDVEPVDGVASAVRAGAGPH